MAGLMRGRGQRGAWSKGGGVLRGPWPMGVQGRRGGVVSKGVASGVGAGPESEEEGCDWQTR